MDICYYESMMYTNEPTSCLERYFSVNEQIHSNIKILCNFWFQLYQFASMMLLYLCLVTNILYFKKIPNTCRFYFGPLILFQFLRVWCSDSLNFGMENDENTIIKTHILYGSSRIGIESKTLAKAP